jgi:transposase
MPASVSLRKDFSAEELRRLAKNATSVSQGRRLLSLAAVLDVFGVGALLPRRLGARRGGAGTCLRLRPDDRFMRRFLFETIHDVARMIDRKRMRREASPSTGAMDSQSVKTPVADARV